MAQPIKDCTCEDFPCCIHADNYPAEPEYCDTCGYTYMGPVCKFCEEPEEEEEDDEPDMEKSVAFYKQVMDDIRANDGS